MTTADWKAIRGFSLILAALSAGGALFGGLGTKGLITCGLLFAVAAISHNMAE